MKNSIFGGVVGVFLFCATAFQAVSAATIGINGTNTPPDVSSTGADVDFSLIPASGGQHKLTISGVSSQNLLHPNGTAYPVLVGPGPFASPSSLYLLELTFDSSGVFVPGSGTIEIAGTPQSLFTGVTAPGSYGSGVVMQATITNFGFFSSNAAGTSGIFEFEALMTGDAGTACSGEVLGGGSCNNDWFSQGETKIGSILNMTNMAFAGGDPGDWDAFGTNIFTDTFSTTIDSAVTLNTFVPVPAAVWLMGSGLVGLVGIGRRNRSRQS